MAVKPIPEARLELARLQSTDFKSVASTDSATQVYLFRIHKKITLMSRKRFTFTDFFKLCN